MSTCDGSWAWALGSGTSYLLKDADCNWTLRDKLAMEQWVNATGVQPPSLALTIEESLLLHLLARRSSCVTAKL